MSRFKEMRHKGWFLTVHFKGDIRTVRKVWALIDDMLRNRSSNSNFGICIDSWKRTGKTVKYLLVRWPCYVPSTKEMNIASKIIKKMGEVFDLNGITIDPPERWMEAIYDCIRKPLSLAGA